MASHIPMAGVYSIGQMGGASINAPQQMQQQRFGGMGTDGMSPAAPKPNPLGYLTRDAPSGEHMMGTSILAVVYDGGVVMGADSRTSSGSYVANRASDKLSPVYQDSIYCCRSGSAADTQAVSDIVKYYLDMHAQELGGNGGDEDKKRGRRPTVKTAANLFKDICYENKNRLMAGIIVGGYDAGSDDGKGNVTKGKGSLYSLPLGGTLHQQQFAVGGSGSTYIYGYLDAEFREGMTKDECIKFVTKGLAHAMSRDGSSGGVIRLAVIDESGCERVFVDHNDLPFRQN